MTRHDRGLIATLTALGLNGKCGDQTPHRAFLDGLSTELSTLRTRLENDDTVDTDDCLRVVRRMTDQVRAFEMMEAEIEAYGREFYRPAKTELMAALEAHEERVIGAVTPEIKKATEEVGRAMALLSNSDDFGAEEAGALGDLLQRINANIWSVRGGLAIDLRDAKPDTPIPGIEEVTP
jgi:hypothetical protein